MKKIIIIGATSGIGRGLAEVYSQEDYLIGITGRRENLLEEVCARDKDKLFYQVCDITDTQATISSLETLTRKMGGMDILIICAGTGDRQIPTLDHVYGADYGNTPGNQP